MLQCVTIFSRAEWMSEISEHPFGRSAGPRSGESALLVNPFDPLHIVGIEEADGPAGQPVLAARVTFDGGSLWRESAGLPMEPAFSGLAGPVLAMDARGTLHLAALALEPHGSRASLVIYRSEDGGLRWRQAARILEMVGECCYSLAADLNPASAFRGNVYLAADAGGALRFARSGDGISWVDSDGNSPGALMPGLCSSPEVLVDSAGAVHLVWINGARILAAHSSDGGGSFGNPVAVADGIAGNCDWLPETVPATCLLPGGTAVCAWADYREGRSRIYCRRSPDSGRTWLGPAAGEPLAPDSAPGQHQFQPHLLVTPAGEICCAFYEYGPKTEGGDALVDLVMAVSYNRGVTFTGRMVLSAKPWNPAEDRPLSRGATKGALAWFSLG